MRRDSLIFGLTAEGEFLKLPTRGCVVTACGEVSEPAEGARLLSEYTGLNLYRGFKSLPLRHLLIKSAAYDHRERLIFLFAKHASEGMRILKRNCRRKTRAKRIGAYAAWRLEIPFGRGQYLSMNKPPLSPVNDYVFKRVFGEHRGGPVC